jgi:nucleoside-diphosphate-sugar epimerase
VGEVINFGSNFEVSIGDTVRMIAEATGRSVEVDTDDQRIRPAASEVERLWADNSKAARLLGWTPSHAGRDGFARGLAKTVEWFAEPANRASYKSGIYNL